ncbi:LuxR C-terminal-related transcriptional regulator [Microvirga yunnanensis]|uniref:LuxR C-terminal-related transcriptional regulator n=1 Tax=Microvirga yunnanensis TaxID=2953740 RepID=UPI0021C89CE0|nr:response regulator transcription factor [Microvirga sp. HBU67655]
MTTDRRVGLIADGDPYFRVAAAAILTHHFGFAELIEASSLDEALERLTENERIEAALLDLSMAGMRTPTNLRAIRECFPHARVAVLSASNARQDILSALEAGVHGYMLKSLPVADLVKALRVVFEGGIYVPPCLADISSGGSLQPLRELPDVAPEPQPVPPEPAPAASVHALTSRQREVLDLLVQGKSNKEIALALKLGEGTVKIHMAAIFRYFGVNNRAAAAVAGARPYPNRPRGVLPTEDAGMPLAVGDNGLLLREI